jgi:uncharacterized membrane protein YeaQ/YmgE (transglycosylase-associated protein family)
MNWKIFVKLAENPEIVGAAIALLGYVLGWIAKHLNVKSQAGVNMKRELGVIGTALEDGKTATQITDMVHLTLPEVNKVIEEAKKQ